ncbi:Acyl-CoA dehydrogenase/oxidase N-terminal domain-containing protein [Caenorhabditis elegans]|uniref:Acyl-CoA dehydrogenase/oxidase N-terminal domain-containing protein n=1 Tax=Caenorhabditis elegans TaxID=6239 RepID=A0A2C9C369_CAEEL|nr:Acyl-CoA dehydrogenase/oxidase N-terminal domain-containing protein [Caenorhabditis elegans]SOF58733.1 Acyl-CoA dehydrogenase/oxidase N-terminal domain-containing protein [Caenorhabditis elegans]|eukprot:NP_001343742.1 Acyl CoA DeHydrogenase [Caenorhabditis elegans]
MFKVPRKLPISAISTFSTTGSISAQQQPRVFPLQHLNENEKKLVEKVKNFAQSSVKPLVREMDRDARINKQLLKKAFDLKLMGLKIDPKYGGSGVSFFELVLAVEELSKIDPAIALIMHLQNALVAPLIEEFGWRLRTFGSCIWIRCIRNANSRQKRWRPLHSQRIKMGNQ